MCVLVLSGHQVEGGAWGRPGGCWVLGAPALPWADLAGVQLPHTVPDLLPPVGRCPPPSSLGRRLRVCPRVHCHHTAGDTQVTRWLSAARHMLCPVAQLVCPAVAPVWGAGHWEVCWNLWVCTHGGCRLWADWGDRGILMHLYGGSGLVSCSRAWGARVTGPKGTPPSPGATF